LLLLLLLLFVGKLFPPWAALLSFSKKKKGKIVPQTHNIVFKPTETLAKNTKKTKTPNARKKMLRPPVESRF
jgi:hypothetical protein